MKRKIKDITLEEINKECEKHMPLCTDNGICPFHNTKEICCMVLELNKPKYLEIEIEVSEND